MEPPPGEATGAKPKTCSTPKPAAAATTADSGPKDSKYNDFWETLLRLDTQISASKTGKGKGVARSHSSVSSLSCEPTVSDADAGASGTVSVEDLKNEATFQSSAFGQARSNHFSIAYQVFFDTFLPGFQLKRAVFP